MTPRGLALGALLALAVAPSPAAAQGSPSATNPASSPSPTERARACRDEAARFSSLFLGGGTPLAGAPAGATLTDDDTSKLRHLIGQARKAAGDNDPAACLKSLGQARALVRQAGVGRGGGAATGSSGLPPGGTGPGTGGAIGGSGTGAGSGAGGSGSGAGGG